MNSFPWVYCDIKPVEINDLGRIDMHHKHPGVVAGVSIEDGEKFHRAEMKTDHKLSHAF